MRHPFTLCKSFGMATAELIGSAEACEILHIDRSTLTRWIRDGKITAHKLPGQTGAFILTRADVERLAAAETKAAP